MTGCGTSAVIWCDWRMQYSARQGRDKAGMNPDRVQGVGIRPTTMKLDSVRYIRTMGCTARRIRMTLSAWYFEKYAVLAGVFCLAPEQESSKLTNTCMLILQCHESYSRSFKKKESQPRQPPIATATINDVHHGQSSPCRDKITAARSTRCTGHGL